MRKFFTAVAIVAGVLVCSASSAFAQATASDPQENNVGVQAFGAGVLKKAQFSSANNQISNNVQGGWVTALADTVVLTASGCIKVDFSAETSLIGSPEGQISGEFRTLIGGVVAEPTPQYFVSPDDNGAGRFETAAFHGWRCGLPVGTYSVVVQYAPNAGAGTTMFLRDRSMTVAWKK